MAATLPSISRPLVHYTIAELEALELPDNGVRYELVHGELLVSQLGSVRHQTIAGRLYNRLSAYLDAIRLGTAWTPGAVVVGDDSELQPDILVAPTPRDLKGEWREITVWWLAVEVLSPSTRNKDLTVKRAAYLEFGVKQIWFVDLVAETVTIVRRDAADVVLTPRDTVSWRAPGAARTTDIDLAGIFADR